MWQSWLRTTTYSSSQSIKPRWMRWESMSDKPVSWWGMLSRSSYPQFGDDIIYDFNFLSNTVHLPRKMPRITAVHKQKTEGRNLCNVNRMRKEYRIDLVTTIQRYYVIRKHANWREESWAVGMTKQKWTHLQTTAYIFFPLLHMASIRGEKIFWTCLFTCLWKRNLGRNMSDKYISRLGGRHWMKWALF